MPGRLALFATVLGAAAAAGTVFALQAKRSGISVRARLVLGIAAIVAPSLGTPEAIGRAIAKDRARGPGKPSRGLLRQVTFHDEMHGGNRRYRLVSKAAAAPLRLLYLHGGGYILDLHSAQLTFAAGLLQRVGGEMVVPLYPLSPEHGPDAALDAVRQAYEALAAESGAGNVVVFGDSAGGGLALILAQALRDAGAPLPAALITFSPWLDVGLTGDDQPAIERRDPMLTIAGGREMGRLWAQGRAVDDPRISPLFGDHQGLPPTLVFSGTRDILDSDVRRLEQRNPGVVVHRYAGMPHVWPVMPIPEGARALDEAAGFIGRHAPAARLTEG
jgi:acetyl esterase/lipase